MLQKGVLLFPLVACTDPKPDTGETADTTCGIADVDLVAVFDRAFAGTADDCDVEALTAFVDERTEDHGPWKQEIRLAFSEDAQTFEPVDGVVIPQAAVPEVVLDDNGRYWLYFVDGRFEDLVTHAATGSTWMASRGVPGLGALGLAVSEDGGATFTPVEDFGVEGIVRGMVVDPDVVRQPDGTWRMYYVGMTAEEYLTQATWVYPESHEVYWASSTDLVHWRQEGSVLRGPYADPTVSCGENDNCMMASFGLEWSRSSDGGTTFTHDGYWGVDGFAPEFVRFEDGSRRLFFNSRQTGAAIQSFLEDEDGIWNLEDGERLEGTYGEAVTLARARPTGWYMWFHTFSDPDDLPF